MITPENCRIFSSKRLRSFPNVLSLIEEGAQNVAVINVRNNQIQDLPSDLTLLQSLSGLNLGQNLISDLPAWFCKLPNLRSLDISGNPMREIPDSISNLTVLETLSLSSIGFTTLPENFSRLVSLKYFDLSQNSFEAIPSQIFSLTNLVLLNLDKNAIRSIPPKICLLKNLIELSIRGNRLEYMPIQITQLTQLKQFACEQNRFGNMRDLVGHAFYKRAIPSLLELACTAVFHSSGVAQTFDSVLKMLPIEIREKLQFECSTCRGCRRIFYGSPLLRAEMKTWPSNREHIFVWQPYCNLKCLSRVKNYQQYIPSGDGDWYE